MDRLVSLLPKIKAFKIHGTAFIGQDHIHDKIPQLLALLIAHGLFKILHIHGVDISADIIHGAVLLLQGLLHDVKQHSKNHVHLFVHLHKPVLLPGGLLDAVLEQHGIKAYAFHPLRELA